MHRVYSPRASARLGTALAVVGELKIMPAVAAKRSVTAGAECQFTQLVQTPVLLPAHSTLLSCENARHRNFNPSAQPDNTQFPIHNGCVI